MATKKAFVNVGGVKVKDAFDRKYKTSLPKILTAEATKVIKANSKLTTVKPREKGETGFDISGNITSIKREIKNNNLILESKVSMQISGWPKKSMFGFVEGKCKIMGDPNPKRLDKEVEFCAKTALNDLMKKKVIPTIVSRAGS